MFGFSCIAGEWASTSKQKNEDLLQKNKNDLLDKWLRRQTMMNNKPTVVVPKDPKTRKK